VLYDFDGARLPFFLESPTGEIVDAASVPSGFQLRASWTDQTRILDFQLPINDPIRYAGRWKLIVIHDGRVCFGDPGPRDEGQLGFLPRDCRESNDPVEYGFAIGIGSNFRLQAYVSPGTIGVGDPILLTGVPTEAGLPVTGCVVTVDATAPNGQMWTAIPLKDDGAHQDGDPDDGEYAAVFKATAMAGTYTFKFRATGHTRDGEPVTRETVRSKYVEGHVTDPPRPDSCERLVEEIRRQAKLMRVPE
jgi:hypothetical protein